MQAVRSRSTRILACAVSNAGMRIGVNRSLRRGMAVPKCVLALRMKAQRGVSLGLSASRQAKDFDMNVKLGSGEPLAGPRRVTPIRDLVRRFSMLTELMMADLGFWPWMAAAAAESLPSQLLHRVRACLRDRSHRRCRLPSKLR